MIDLQNEFTFVKFVDGVQRVWDASSLDALQRCPFLYDTGYRTGWKPRVSSTVTGFGKAVHRACEVLDICKFKGLDKEESIREAIQVVCHEFKGALVESTEGARNLEATIRAIVWRADVHYVDDINIATMPNGEPALEVRFEIPFTGDCRLSGRVDKVVVLPTGKLYIVDTKTTKSELSEYFFKRYLPSNQVYAYVYALRNVLGLPVEGFMIEGIQTGVNFTRFGRWTYIVSDAQLREWYQDMTDLLDNHARYVKTGVWPKHFSACNDYGGCKFREVCAASVSVRQSVLESEYVLRPYGTRTSSDQLALPFAQEQQDEPA